MTCRVNFHTQAADKAGEKNSDHVKRLLQAVYDIMAPKGKDAWAVFLESYLNPHASSALHQLILLT